VFSRRSDHEREPNAITVAFANARARGALRADLTTSNPTLVGLGLDADAIRSAYAGLPIDRYDPDPRGSHASREAFAKRLGLDASRILLTASTSEAYSFALSILADAGDSILVPRPSYPLLEWLARLAGVELIPYDLRYDGSWYVDFDSIVDEVARRAKAIVVVSPNNPTGSRLRDDERDRLLSYGTPLVIDEVFADFPLDVSVPSAPRRPREGLIFRLTGLSKLAALPQMKLGCIGVDGDQALVDEAYARLELVADTFLSVSTPSDLAASRLIDATALVRERIVARCRANLARLDSAVSGTTLTRLRAEAGWSAIVRFPALATEDSIVLALLDEGVAVQPGWFFDLPRGPHVVVSLIGDESEFAFAAERLVRVAESRRD